jgi:hypothetical protein
MNLNSDGKLVLPNHELLKWSFSSKKPPCRIFPRSATVFWSSFVGP